jgi:hypothetical protein
MPLPQPEGIEDRIRALEQAVLDLRSSLTNQGGITTASAGLIFSARSIPSAPASGGHLYAQGTDPYWTKSNGSTVALIQDFPQGSGVSNAVDSISGGAPGEYDASYMEDVADTATSAVNRLNDLLDSLRGAGHIGL